jgi:hypothetical protein
VHSWPTELAAARARAHALGFTPHSLEPAPGLIRWMDFFQHDGQGRVGEVWVGHRWTEQLPSPPECRYLTLGTVDSAYFGRSLGRKPVWPELARTAAFALANLTLPRGDVPRPPGFLKRLFAFVTEQSREYASWRSTEWTVSGVSQPVRVWEFAGGWAAFVQADLPQHLLAVGEGVGWADRRVRPLDSLSDCGIESAGGLRALDLPSPALAPQRPDFDPAHRPFLD